MKEIYSLGKAKELIWQISEFNTDKRQNEVAREMLTPEGCTYIEPDTVSIENTIYVKRPDIKRALLKIITQNLINQNPPRESAIK